MKNIILVLTLILFTIVTLTAQIITGIVTDSNGVRLAGVDITLYSLGKTVKTTSDYTGAFTIDLLTHVENTSLPEGYSISNNYPNPFNPKTRIDFTLPKASNIKAEIFNVAGQRVRDVIETNLSTGSNHLDLELNGLPNGFYFARIVIDGSYTVTKKLMLLYGSQHLNAAGNLTNTKIGKTTNDILIDSIIISSGFIERTKINPPAVSGGIILELGKIKVLKLAEKYTPCNGISTLKYIGKLYHTVQIGSQCWLKENLDAGVMIKGEENQTNNNILEKYCYDDNLANCATYGALYQWDEAMLYNTGEKTRGICPAGWHIPTKAEFDTLVKTANYDSNNLKSTGQGTDFGVGTNGSGFSALQAGNRLNNSYHRFYYLCDYTHFWSSTMEKTDLANYMVLYSNHCLIGFGGDNKTTGFSVRCIKDN